MKNQEYWKSRMIDLERSLHRDAEEVVHDLDIAYRSAERQIEADLSRWYQRFADNNGIVSMADARKLLTSGELKEFKWTVQDYIKHGRENGIFADWSKELENASARWHISRLEAIRYQMQNTVEVLAGGQLDSLDDLIKQTYLNGYGQTAFTIQSGIGIGFDIAGINDRALQTVLQKPWALDGKNFSDRIWENKTALVNELQKQLSQNMMRGGNINDVVDAIQQKFGVSRSNAARLVYTENAYAISVATGDSYRATGVEKVIFIATLDERTSEICQSMDGTIIEMKDYSPGVTVPPLHPWCRSTTAPYYSDMDGIGERIARGEDGKTYYVPRSMKYPEWKQTFMGGESGNSGSKLKEKLTQIINDTSCQLAVKLGQSTYSAMQQMVAESGNDDLKRVWNENHTKVKVGSTKQRTRQYAKGDTIFVNAAGNVKGDSSALPYQVNFHESGHAIDTILSRKMQGSSFLHFSSRYQNGLFPQTIKDEVQGLVDAQTQSMKNTWEAHKGDWQWLSEHGYIDKWQYNWYTQTGNWLGSEPKFSMDIVYRHIESEVKGMGWLKAGDLSDILEGATNGRISAGCGHGKKYWKDRTYNGVADGLATEAFAEMTDSELANHDSLDVLKQWLPKSYQIYCDMLKEALK